MEEYIWREGWQEAFVRQLRAEERSRGTVEKYLRDVERFSTWLAGRAATREEAVAWKEALLQKGYAPATINSMLAAVNKFSQFMGWTECRVKALRLQRRMFRPADRELTREEYSRLVAAAQTRGRERLGLLLETICATGIRVSEVAYITVEAIERERAEISLKGKIRTILLPKRLCQKLRKYARHKKIVSGEIFLTRNGTGLSRQQIWAEMKALCQQAGVAPEKVFPHNLRHLFARTFYQTCRDVVKLADMLGHSSVETTRIYLLTTSEEHARDLERLRLVS